MASRSATVLVIFVIAIIAFCLASVFGAMTGPISIFPNETEGGSILDNLSALTDGHGDTGNSYGNDNYNDYSSSSSDSSSSNVETTTDDSSSSNQKPSDPSEKNPDSGKESDSGGSNVITYTG
ncbi:hypothetical protein [Methanobrevibacter sp.]|uniref:hypothetical protein n=1 Tax=Methanobrevibacter sp. TaxID=66852 RepID=UPI0038701135